MNVRKVFGQIKELHRLAQKETDSASKTILERAENLLWDSYNKHRISLIDKNLEGTALTSIETKDLKQLQKLAGMVRELCS